MLLLLLLMMLLLVVVVVVCVCVGFLIIIIFWPVGAVEGGDLEGGPFHVPLGDVVFCVTAAAFADIS